jgi:hypothetical protein
MNHKCARKRQSDGRWDYTYNGGPWGYCREYRPLAEDGRIIPAGVSRYENEKMDSLKGKFHTDGHATEQEACDCFKQYQLDTALRLQAAEPENASQQHKCQICRKWTACHAQVGAYQLFVLCPEHQTRECVESLFSVGESWES